MTLTVPTYEPTELTPGAAWSWDPTYSDFPANESWQLNYYLRGLNGALVFTFAWGTHVTAGSGAGFEVRVTAAQSGALKLLGGYRLVGRVTKAADDFDGTIVYNAPVLALANPAASLNTAEIVGKSDNRRILEALHAATLEIVGGVAMYKSQAVNGRAAEFWTPGERISQIAHYTLLVALEENPDAEVSHAGEFQRA